MQCNGNIVGLGHRGDLAGLGDAAGVRGVGLDDVDTALRKHALEIPARVEALTQRDGCGADGGQLGDHLQVLAEHRLLDEHQVEIAQLAHQHLGHGLVHPAVEVHTNADVLAHRFADHRHIGDGLLHLGVAVDVLHLFGAVHLHGGKAARHRRLRLGRRVCRAITPYPGVDADAVTHLAAQQPMHRHAQRLALDVPQRLIHAGDGAHHHRAAPVEAGAVHHIPQVLHIARVAAHQVVGQLLNRSGYGVGTAFDDRLAPADDTFVGVDLEKAPARGHDKGGELDDFHGKKEEEWVGISGCGGNSFEVQQHLHRLRAVGRQRKGAG